MKFLMFILMFLVIGALLIISNHQLALNESKNVETFLDSYISWLDNVFSNTKDVFAKTSELNWQP